MQEDLRLYAVVPKNLRMPKGKLAAQTGHAYLAAFLNCDEDRQLKYLGDQPAGYVIEGQTKICLAVEDVVDLVECKEACDRAGLNSILIQDCARTVFDKPTLTCLGIGPCYKKELPKWMQELPLL